MVVLAASVARIGSAITSASEAATRAWSAASGAASMVTGAASSTKPQVCSMNSTSRFVKLHLRHALHKCMSASSMAIDGPGLPMGSSVSMNAIVAAMTDAAGFVCEWCNHMSACSWMSTTDQLRRRTPFASSVSVASLTIVASSGANNTGPVPSFASAAVFMSWCGGCAVSCSVKKSVA